VGLITVILIYSYCVCCQSNVTQRSVTQWQF